MMLLIMQYFCLVFQQGQVVKITKETPSKNGTTKVALDVALLKKIFYKYENYLVAVYTVSGPFRTGKSFLQNLLVRYLKSLQLAQVKTITHIVVIKCCFLLISIM